MADKQFSKTVKVRHAGYTYLKKYDQVLPSTGELVRSWSPVIAMRDEEITLEFQGDYDRGIREDAFYTDDHDPESGVPLAFLQATGQIEEDWPEAEPDEITVDDATDQELIDFVDKHNIAEVLELADTPERAQRLLTAENGRTGADPRVSLVAELEKRIEA